MILRRWSAHYAGLHLVVQGFSVLLFSSVLRRGQSRIWHLRMTGQLLASGKMLTTKFSEQGFNPFHAPLLCRHPTVIEIGVWYNEPQIRKKADGGFEASVTRQCVMICSCRVKKTVKVVTLSFTVTTEMLNFSLRVLVFDN